MVELDTVNAYFFLIGVNSRANVVLLLTFTRAVGINIDRLLVYVCERQIVRILP